jgi:hypothetical protein
MANRKPAKRFSAEERAAMKERARALKAEREGNAGESDVLAKIAEMSEPDRGMAERLHALVKIDEGAMFPTTFALKELTAAEEARIGALVKKAVS